MTNLNQNFIAGEWLAGASEVANINPSDLSDIIGHYAQVDSAQLQRALDAAQASPYPQSLPTPRRGLSMSSGSRKANKARCT